MNYLYNRTFVQKPQKVSKNYVTYFVKEIHNSKNKIFFVKLLKKTTHFSWSINLTFNVFKIE